jgi:hypothetical protein
MNSLGNNYEDAIKYIDYMLSKKEKDSESIKIGRECASYYKNRINDIRSNNKININELKERVQYDYEDILNDSKHRLKCQTTFDNVKMMTLILNYILSI